MVYRGPPPASEPAWVPSTSGAPRIAPEVPPGRPRRQNEPFLWSTQLFLAVSEELRPLAWWPKIDNTEPADSDDDDDDDDAPPLALQPDDNANGGGGANGANGAAARAFSAQ